MAEENAEGLLDVRNLLKSHIYLFILQHPLTSIMCSQAHQPSDEPDNDMEAALSAAEKAGNTDRNFVDFEQLLQASGLNLSSKSRENLVPAPQGTNQPRNLFDKAFQSFSSAPGQNVEPLRCSGDEIFAHVPRVVA